LSSSRPAVALRIPDCGLRIAAPLSRQLISGELADHSRVTVEFKKGELVFEAKAAKK